MKSTTDWRFVPVALIGLAWLNPNHYAPWAAFHSDWLATLALIAMLAVVAFDRRRPALSLPASALAVAVLALVPLLQSLAGQTLFFGDALIAAAYMAGLSISIAAGANATRGQLADTRFSEVAALLVLLAALLSLGVALTQWLRLDGFGIWSVDMPVGGRPYGNLGQPNMLATLLFLGLCGALFLYERTAIGLTGLMLSGVLICFGVAMTQSRVGWVEFTTLIGWLLVQRRRARLRVPPWVLFFFAAVLLISVVGWERLCETLMLSQGRELREQLTGGARLIHWETMLDAALRQPWLGYGWNQSAVAQAVTANDHRASFEMVEHAHSILLDLVIWNGFPLALLILAGAIAWLWSRFRACRDAGTIMLMVAVLILIVHSLIEFPLEYAFFLFPFGFMLGVLDTSAPVTWAVRIPRVAAVFALLGCIALTSWITWEYAQAEESYRDLRFEGARIGPPRTLHAPDLVLLTQLREFLHFANTQARRGMPPEELDMMRDVAARYGHPPVLFRYALASALNGRPDQARDTLRRLCKTQMIERCEEGREAWVAASQGEFPELRAVEFPAVPTLSKR
ncbi:Wzy polymerase domain-containing protein [Rhizobacter sp. P5_C2]